MGDLIKKTAVIPEANSLEEKVMERELKRQESVHVENETIDKLAKKPGNKDKAISARVNGATYASFKKICRARGLTSNACLNMLITDFVRENKKVLENADS